MAEYSNAADKEWGPQYDNLAYQPELVSRLQRTWPNTQKQTLFSGESNNDWDDMPSDYSSNGHNCKKFLIIFGILLVVIGVAAGIVVAIYFSGQEAPVTLAPEPQVIVESSVKLNDTYVPALADMSSPEAQQKAKEFEEKMDKIYQNSSLAGVYNRTKEPDVPIIKIDLSIIFEIMNSTESKTLLSITVILKVDFVTPGTTAAPPETTAAPPETTVTVPVTTGMYL
ncbi:Hypothetical predicted protein [Octopus vulgaris]|uniref:SEA domain-containing protein n=1 Tax=Octopus vulgaris TaxID=6645 RepID=A0AA36BTE1_OCTVU|nr:Hypothetical predicted protein [Octopus vulgaris]